MRKLAPAVAAVAMAVSIAMQEVGIVELWRSARRLVCLYDCGFPSPLLPPACFMLVRLQTGCGCGR